MSEIKVNKVSPATGTAIQLGDSGDTFTVPSGCNIVNSGTATGFGGGLVLQCSSVTKTDVYTSSATSWTDVSDLVIAMTPTSSGNKFLITAHLHAANSTANNTFQFRLTVDGTAVGVGDAGGSNRARVNIQGMIPNVSDATASSSCQFLYTTTGSSAHSIKVQHQVAGGTLVLNRTQGDNSDALTYGRSSSTITVMEISV